MASTGRIAAHAPLASPTASASGASQETSQDTVPPEVDDKTDADLGSTMGALAQTVFGPEPRTGISLSSGAGEATRVGPPPNLDAFGVKPRAHADPAPSPPRSHPESSSRSGLQAPVSAGSSQPMPLNPTPTPPAPDVLGHGRTPAPRGRVEHRLPTRPHDAVEEGTRVGLAPPASLPGTAPAPALIRQCRTCQGRYPADFLVCPRDAAPLVAALDGEDPLLGKCLNDTYQIVRVVGEGGMGRVYEARHLRLKERRFAVKCLHTDLARIAEMSARFLREAESASSIKHENVVDVFDVHHLPDGTPYLVGEFLEGEDLAKYVKKHGPIEARTAAVIGRQIANALLAAHARGIVHRDIKPENIFVLASSTATSSYGESLAPHVKVLDFGISKVENGDGSQLTRTGIVMGTPSYMAPEQARGRSVDSRADVYSVGACLYFMVTGHAPFESDDPTTTLTMVLTEEPVRPRDLDRHIPEVLELVIQRAMAKEASDRYGSMSDLDKALASFVGKSPLLSTASGQPPSVRPSTSNDASRALDIAKAVLSASSKPPPSQQQAHLVRTARPMIVLTSATLGAWLVFGTVTALAGLVRVLRDGEITLTESLLLVIGCLFAAGTPVALYVMHVRKVIWPNSVRATELAIDLKRIAVAAFVAYGLLAIFGRLVCTVFWRTSTGLASGFWDIALFVISVGMAASIGGFVSTIQRRRRRRRRLD